MNSRRLPGRPLPEPLPRIIGEFVDDLRAALGRELVGVYLYGSAMAGGFEPTTSDLDVLVVTASSIDALDLAIFGGLIDRLMAREPEWSDRLDIAFVDRQTVVTFRDGGPLLSISHDEPLRRWDSAADWLQTWYLVRSADTAVLGPPPSELIPAIETDEFIRTVVDGADGLIERLSADRRAGLRAYLVLSLGRILRTLETGVPCSKIEGAARIIGAHPESRWIVDECLAIWRARGRTPFSPEAEVALEGLAERLGSEIRARRRTSASTFERVEPATD